MSWYDEMLGAMSKFVSERINEDVTVSRYEDRTQYEGYCETCSYEYQVIDFYDQNGNMVYTYTGGISSLMDELTEK